ncbi:hypothetical protein EDB80DRAFT_731947 [Ilyonectria destructans]|nr:hypothetical protein EDB80DRAFT_731947 [Ilyonectria destructans]
MPFDITARTIVLTLKAPSGAGKSSAEVEAITGVTLRSINYIYRRAIQRGFQPEERPFRIRDEHVQDAPRSGRPRKDTPEAQQLVISKRSARKGLRFRRLQSSGFLRQLASARLSQQESLG